MPHNAPIHVIKSIGLLPLERIQDIFSIGLYIPLKPDHHKGVDYQSGYALSTFYLLSNNKILRTNMGKIILIVFCFFMIFLYAQDKKTYDVVYNKTLLETSKTSPQYALRVADSLYSISSTPLYQSKSLILSATIYKRQGQMKKSLEKALKAEHIIERSNEPVGKAYVYGYLATQYRVINLYNVSERYLEKAFEASNKIEDVKTAECVLGILWQEKAYSEIERKDYKKALEYLGKSQRFLHSAKSNEEYFIANNEKLMGLSYYYLHDFEKSLEHYNKALDISEDISENRITGRVYNGLARVYIEKGNLNRAHKYIELALGVSDVMNDLQLKKEIYDTSNKYYTLLQDVDGIKNIQNKRDSIIDKISNRADIFINDLHSTLEERNSILQQNKSIKNWLIVATCMLLIVQATFFSQYKRKLKENLKNINSLITKKRAANSLIRKNSVSLPIAAMTKKAQDNPPSADDIEEGTLVMTDLMEQKLLSKLEEFEGSTLFTKRNISLSYLATYCGSNTRYLSHIINTYKKKDFNNYINELRIQYIIEKLQSSPQYRKYKVATLANEAGFSSPNKFSTVFKKEISMPPSLYIKHLLEEEF